MFGKFKTIFQAKKKVFAVKFSQIVLQITVSAYKYAFGKHLHNGNKTLKTLVNNTTLFYTLNCSVQNAMVFDQR